MKKVLGRIRSPFEFAADLIRHYETGVAVLTTGLLAATTGPIATAAGFALFCRARSKHSETLLGEKRWKQAMIASLALAGTMGVLNITTMHLSHLATRTVLEKKVLATFQSASLPLTHTNLFKGWTKDNTTFRLASWVSCKNEGLSHIGVTTKPLAGGWAPSSDHVFGKSGETSGGKNWVALSARPADCAPVLK